VDNWLVNGVAASTIRLDDRGLSYGDGLFETIAVRSGSCRFLAEHLERLRNGCTRLRIPLPDEELLHAEVATLAANAEHATLKIIITRGPGPRGYRLPEPCTPTRIVGVQPTSPTPFPVAGVRIRYCATLLGRNPALAGIKTLNRLEQILARAEWNTSEIAEGLMLNDREEIVCGTMTNLFYGRDGILFTPHLSDCGVNGIMRQQVFSVAAELGIEVREAAVRTSALNAAEEIFLTNALIGLWPVGQLENQRISQGPISLAIRAGLAKRGVQECA
jgi:4-amino-4-deoxychorismate lyase